MSIRPELREYYGKTWREYRRSLIEIHGAVCSKCRRSVAAYLNLCHVTHDPRSSAVALMCAACHNRHDAGQRLAVWRRNKAKRSGQLWLMPELEWAVFPGWMIPRRALAAMADAAQTRLWEAKP